MTTNVWVEQVRHNIECIIYYKSKNLIFKLFFILGME